MPLLPDSWKMLSRLLLALTLLLIAVLVDGLSGQLFSFWFLESVGFQSVFWTNFTMQAWLFLIVGGLTFAAIAIPAFTRRITPSARKGVLWIGALLGLLHGWYISFEYLEFIMPTAAEDFGRTVRSMGLMQPSTCSISNRYSTRWRRYSSLSSVV